MVKNKYKFYYNLYCISFIVVLLSISSPVYAHPFLWEVTGEHEFYMFGTIHLPDPRVTDIPEEVKRALQESNFFYAELDLSEENTMMIKQSMWLPERQSLYDYLTPGLEAEISDYLKIVNPELSLEYFSKQKLWVLAITLTVLEQQLKYPELLPLDSVLYEYAVSLNLETGGLETVEEQLYIFDSITIEQQITLLKDTVEFLKLNRVNNRAYIEDSLKAYIRGDINALMTHLMSYMKDNEFYDNLINRLIYQRNKKMSQKILSLVNSQPEVKYFFAIGAGHFWGDKGIHSILEEQGYKIKAID